MRGSTIPTLIVAVLVVTGWSIYMFIWSMNNVEVTISSKTLQQSLDTIAVTHLIESCFKQDNDYVSQQFLKENEGKSICQICRQRQPNLCRFNPEIIVENAQSKETFNFGFAPSKLSDKHKLFINIENGGRIEVGSIEVRI